MSKYEIDETWKAIEDYEGIYEVSDVGRVRVIVKRHSVSPHVLNPSSDRYGYKRVNLQVNSIRKGFAVHRLVAGAFIGYCPKDMEVNHKDGDKTNNHIGNLEYTTHVENIRHSFRELGRARTVPRGEDAGMAKLTYGKVTEIKDMLIGGYSHRHIAVQFDVSYVAIGCIARGKTWTHHKNNKDGWQSTGKRKIFSKLTAEQVKDVRRQLADGVKGASIARQYNVNPSTISSIKTGKNWSVGNDG